MPEVSRIGWRGKILCYDSACRLETAGLYKIRLLHKAYLMKQRSCFPALKGHALRYAPEGIPQCKYSCKWLYVRHLYVGCPIQRCMLYAAPPASLGIGLI